MSGTIFLADTSIYVLRNRSEPVKRRFDALLAEGRLAACHMTASAAMDRAVAIHSELGKRNQHRNFRLADLIIAATAELNRATVLHYDADYDRIAAVTGHPSEWVVPKGSI